ncbi:MAG: lysoplasmalogenase [Promethearchaeota archaeon]
MITIIILIIYGIMAVADIVVVEKRIKKLEYVFKCSLMPLLILYYVVSMVGTAMMDVLIILALIGGFFGDFFLVLENEEKWFIFGMLAFLLGHVFYIFSFIFSLWSYFAAGFPITLVFIILLLFVPGVILIGFTYPKFSKYLGEMNIPVHIYMIAILTMHVFATLRVIGFGVFSFILTWLGSILFISSDSLIAIKTFNKELKLRHVDAVIMATYILGQFFIIQGVLIA